MIKNLTIGEVSEATMKPWITLMRELWPDHTRASLVSEAKIIIDSKKETAFLLSNDDKWIGFINVSIHTDHVPGTSRSKVGYIEGIYIKPKLRHRGMAKKLVEHASHWFLVNGCKEMASDTEIDNVVSQGWHEAMGFSKVSVLVHYSKKINR